MNTERQRLYEELESKIGKTPLVKYKGEIPNGNKILVKRECDNPFGSHYDRVYVELFRHYEEAGNLVPGSKVIETTSGSAGVSFAGVGKALGYECCVAIPAGGEKARETAILEHLPDENHLIFTPQEQYISGFPRFLKRFLVMHRDYFFLNHSMGLLGTKNEITLKSLEKIAEEILLETCKVSYFIPAIGNGSSVLGPARVFKDVTQILRGTIRDLIEEPSNVGMVNALDIEKAHDYLIKVIAFETFQSAVAYNLKYPGKYEKEFGIKPGTLPRHRLPGTSYPGISFPHINTCIQKDLIHDIILVSDEKTDQEYTALTGRTDTRNLVHWDKPIVNFNDVGRTTRAGINVALDIAKQVRGRNLVVLAYDKAERYDS